MVVRLRLARHGTRNNPFYHIVAIRDKAARNARPIEKLGEYDPIPRPRLQQQQQTLAGGSSGSAPQASAQRPHFIGPVLTSGLEKTEENMKLEKRIEWNVQRIHHWLGVGAQPSKPVARLLDRAGLIPEGKFYKGMYRPDALQAQRPHAKTPSSIILEAAGISQAQQQRPNSSGESAAVPLRQGEVAGNAAKTTNPKSEAVKKQVGPSSIDQAAWPHPV